MYTRNKEAAFAQSVVFCLFAAFAIFVGASKVVGGIAQSREVNDGVCGNSSYGILNVWRFLFSFSGELDGCTVAHNTEVLQWQSQVILVFVLCAVIYAAWFIYTEGPIGAEDLLSAIGIAIIGGAALAVVAVIVIVYLLFIAFVAMTGIVIAMAASSSRK